LLRYLVAVVVLLLVVLTLYGLGAMALAGLVSCLSFVAGCEQPSHSVLTFEASQEPEIVRGGEKTEKSD